MRSNRVRGTQTMLFEDDGARLAGSQRLSPEPAFALTRGAVASCRAPNAGASVLIPEAGPPVTRAATVERFRNSPRRGDWMSSYPPAPRAPHPIYQPVSNNYLVQGGPYPYPAE